MSGYDKFHTYLCELDQNYQKLSALLQEKLSAIENFDTSRLDSIIREEQVYVLVSRGFDSNIENHRESLGLSGEKLSAIIEELPEGEQQRFRDIFRRLEATLAAVKGLNDRCQSLIQERLYTLDKSIKRLDKSAASTYGKDVSPKPGGSDTHFLTKSV